MYREGGVACELTPDQLGEHGGGGGEGGGGGGGCVNWNIFYTNCTTGPHNPHHGAVSFDNIGTKVMSWILIKYFLSQGWPGWRYL